MPTGQNNRGRRIKYLEAAKLWGISVYTLKRLWAEDASFPLPDGVYGYTKEPWWYLDTLASYRRVRDTDGEQQE
jgi:hypothetical protein